MLIFPICRASEARCKALEEELAAERAPKGGIGAKIESFAKAGVEVAKSGIERAKDIAEKVRSAAAEGVARLDHAYEEKVVPKLHDARAAIPDTLKSGYSKAHDALHSVRALPVFILLCVVSCSFFFLGGLWASRVSLLAAPRWYLTQPAPPPLTS